MNKREFLFNIDKSLNNSIQIAEKLFWEGKIFAYPTDTIYCLGANPFNEDALNRIASIKGRELGKLYILLINNIENLLKHIEIKSENHVDLLLSMWPNPVSVVLKLNKTSRDLLGIEKAAFRIPNNRFCQKLLDQIKIPLLATSVNRDGQAPLSDHHKIDAEFSEEIDALFYTNKKSYFNKTSLLDLSNGQPSILRNGKINLENLIKKFH